MSEFSLFKKNMIVILTHGRMATTKAIILDKLSDGRLLVSGFIKRKDTKAYKSKGARMYIKRVNPMHLLATSYSTDISCPKLDVDKIFENAKFKKDTLENIEKILSQNKNSTSISWMKQRLVI